MLEQREIGFWLGEGSDREPLRATDRQDCPPATGAGFQSKISTARGRTLGPEEILQKWTLRKRCCRLRCGLIAKARPWI